MLYTCWVPMTWTCVLAVMLVATLVATHSHSPWSSLVSDLNCKLPRGKTLCLHLLGFPTYSPLSQTKEESASERRKEVHNRLKHAIYNLKRKKNLQAVPRNRARLQHNVSKPLIYYRVRLVLKQMHFENYMQITLHKNMF